MRQRRRQLTREQAVEEDVCGPCRTVPSVARPCHSARGGTRGRTLEVRRDGHARRVLAERDEVLDDTAKETRAVVGFGAFAKLVENEERARREVAEGKAEESGEKRVGVSQQARVWREPKSTEQERERARERRTRPAAGRS